MVSENTNDYDDPEAVVTFLWAWNRVARPALRKLYRKLDGYVSLAFGCLIELAGLVAGISAATWTIRYVLSTPISFLLKLAILPTGTILSFALCFVIPITIASLNKHKARGDPQSEALALRQRERWLNRELKANQERQVEIDKTMIEKRHETQNRSHDRGQN